MLTSILVLATCFIPSHVQAETLQWDDVGHSSFSLTVDHNLSETIILTQITYDSNTYELVDPIIINASTSLLTTIQTVMSFEDPIDDIKQASIDDYRSHPYDYQSISRSKVASLLELVHNGTLEYTLNAYDYKHVLTDGTLDTFYMKSYPINASCPTTCKNPTQQPFLPPYGGTICTEACNVYRCEYNDIYWGGGSCDPLGVDDNVTAIESQFEAWFVVMEGDSIDYRIRLMYGYDDPAADTVYNNRWSLKYLDNSGGNIDKQCDSATVHWDNGYIAGEIYKPIPAVGNEYRKVSYSLKNISVLSMPSVNITIGGFSDSQCTSNGDVITQAISDKLSYERVIMDDIGYHDYTATNLFSNSSAWLFINTTYFGTDCDQIMVDQLTWEAATCGDCMNHVLSTWSTDDYGVSTIPYYDDLDLSNGIQEAVQVVTNVTKFSEDDIAINFNYIFPTAAMTISSANFAFKQPAVCNATSEIQIFTSTKTANVSFTNCGTVSSDFTFTINCANTYYDSTFASVTVASVATKSGWTSDVTNSNCDTISSVTITASPCLEFWNSTDTCTWDTIMTTLTPEPTPLPTPFPTGLPTLQPTDDPTLAPTPFPSTSPSPDPTPYPTEVPTPNPTDDPTLSPTLGPTTPPSPSPTAAPVSFFASCTAYQVIPVRGAIDNTIVHQELCLASKKGSYIVDINANKPYYVSQDSASVSNTTINKVNTEDYDSGADSNTVATGSALIGHSIISIETWYDVLAYLGLDVSGYTSSQSVITSIKVDGLSLATSFSQEVFSTKLKEQMVSELGIDEDQITVGSLRRGSIIANIEISSETANAKSALEVNVDLQNYIASHAASTPSITAPLDSVNNFFYANETHHIVFTNCPYRITATSWEGEIEIVSWDEPTVRNNVDADDIVVYQAIGETSGESFAAGSYFVRYVALSASNTSVIPKYCSFAIVVEEQEWALEFMGIEFSITTLIIIATVLFCICTGSICFSCRKRRCCKKKKSHQRVEIKSDAETNGGEPDNNFKSVIVSSHNAPSNPLLNSPQAPKLNITRTSG